MPNIAEVLKKEIARVARKEIKVQTEDLRKFSTAQRKLNSELRQQVAVLERKVALLEPKVLIEQPKKQVEETIADQARFSRKGLLSQRKRLGLTAAEFGKLIGVSGQSIYNWETGKARPRSKQLAALGELRGLGKREAKARLELLSQA